MKAPFATANQIARAIVAASCVVGADPLDVADKANAGGHNTPISRARYLAFAALRDVLPKCDQWAIARGLGFKSNSAVSNLRATRKLSAWWREDWVAEIAAAIHAAARPEPAQPPSAPPPEPVQVSETYSKYIPPATCRVRLARRIPLLTQLREF